MADEIPVIPKAGTLFINSGNIVNWNRLKRKPSQSPTEEISECVGSTLESFLTDADKNELQYVTDLNCVHQKFQQIIPKEERGELKLTVKIFLCTLGRPKAIKDAVERALEELDVKVIETALLAFPETENEALTIETLKPYWMVLENLVHRELVWSVGMADLNIDLLEQLYEWAETSFLMESIATREREEALWNLNALPKGTIVTATAGRELGGPFAPEANALVTFIKVKPVINQVNLDSCCVIPPDLVAYAKSNDIQLLTHNDPRNVFPNQTLQDVIREKSTAKDSENWEPEWVLRYSVLVKCRGIIKSKGYLLKAVRDIKNRK